MLSGRPARARPKCSSAARSSSSRKTSFSPSSWRVLGHEHGSGGPRVAGQPFDHLADLLAAGFREADATPYALGGQRHQTLLDDIAGMLEIGREGQDFRQTPMIDVVERIAVDRGAAGRSRG